MLARVIAVLLLVETGGEPVPDRAVGDGGSAVGCLQIRPCAVAAANRIVGWERWTLADRWDREASVEMARVTLAWHYRRGCRDEAALAARWHRPHGRPSPRYLRRVRAALVAGAQP